MTFRPWLSGWMCGRRKRDAISRGPETGNPRPDVIRTRVLPVVLLWDSPFRSRSTTYSEKRRRALQGSAAVIGPVAQTASAPQQRRRTHRGFFTYVAITKKEGAPLGPLLFGVASGIRTHDPLSHSQMCCRCTIATMSIALFQSSKLHGGIRPLRQRPPTYLLTSSAVTPGSHHPSRRSAPISE